MGMFKPGVTHLIEQVTLKPATRAGHEAVLRIRVQCELITGDSINQLVNENWQLSVDAADKFTIHSYQVLAVYRS